jgi:hypothetical protein
VRRMDAWERCVAEAGAGADAATDWGGAAMAGDSRLATRPAMAMALKTAA